MGEEGVCGGGRLEHDDDAQKRLAHSLHHRLLAPPTSLVGRVDNMHTCRRKAEAPRQAYCVRFRVEGGNRVEAGRGDRVEAGRPGVDGESNAWEVLADACLPTPCLHWRLHCGSGMVYSGHGRCPYPWHSSLRSLCRCLYGPHCGSWRGRSGCTLHIRGGATRPSALRRRERGQPIPRG